MDNKALYQSLEARLPLFFRSWWLDAVCDGGWDVAIYHSGDEVRAVWPYQLERKWGFSLIRNPRLTPYLGPFFLYGADGAPRGMVRWDEEETALQALLDQMPRHDYFQFHAWPGFANFLPLLHRGFSNTNRITYRIDLSQEEEVLLGRMQKRRRRYIKNAAGWSVSPAGPELTDTFFQMHHATFTRKGGSYRYERRQLETLMQAAAAQQAACFWVVRQDGGPVAGMLWTVHDQDTMYQLLSTYAAGAHQHTAMSLLTWHAIREARNMGLQTFDFEGSIHPGIEPFFRKFGGDRVPFIAFEQYHSRLWKWKKMWLG